MKSYMLSAISVLSFIGVFLWGLQDPSSFLLVLHGLLAVFVIVSLFFIAYNLWKGGDNCDDYVVDSDKLN